MKSDIKHNILKSPMLKQGIDLGSRTAVCIDLYCRDISGNDRKVGSGSGFFHTREGKSYLITNWHVLTGRNPKYPEQLLEGYPTSPSAFTIHLSRKVDPNHFVPSDTYPLYNGDGSPRWFETINPNRNSSDKIDLAALMFDFSVADDKPLITPIELFAPNGKDYLYVGRDVVIVGYPFGINGLNPYPIWKHGYVASEPSLLVGGMPKFYIDSPGRPGMSGSPVFMISKGIGVSKQTAKVFQDGNSEDALEALHSLNLDDLKNMQEVNILQFAGVYSGTVGDNSLERLRVGVAWHAAMVDQLFTS